MGEVIRPKNTRFKVPITQVAEGMIESKIDPAVVIGITPDGELFVSSTTSTVPELVYLMESAKLELMRPTEESC